VGKGAAKACYAASSGPVISNAPLGPEPHIARRLAIEDEDHFHASFLHLLTRRKGALQVREIEGFALVAHPTPVRRQIKPCPNVPNQTMRRWLEPGFHNSKLTLDSGSGFATKIFQKKA
jgi:hypothetical protein